MRFTITEYFSFFVHVGLVCMHYNALVQVVFDGSIQLCEEAD